MKEEIKEAMPLTEKEAMKLQIIEKQNDITRFKVLERLHNREKLSGGNEKFLKKLAQLQQMAKAREKEVETLLGMYKDADETTPLEKKL